MQKMKLRLGLSHGIRNDDVQAFQPTYSFLNRSLAICSDTHILKMLSAIGVVDSFYKTYTMDCEAFDFVFFRHLLDHLLCPFLACVIIDRNITSLLGKFLGYQSA